jgi:NAD(P)-dependent dehydrogenase (short-subunit alcohol dehydrogenase family)
MAHLLTAPLAATIMKYGPRSPWPATLVDKFGFLNKSVQKALPLMQDGGSIIMTGSIASAKGFPGLSVYKASKAAIRSFARTWTADLKDRHIRVNVISPGTIDTGVFTGVPQEVKDQFVSIIPMGRIGQPREIATAALFLASDDSSFVTGIELFVDGGTAQI